MQEHRYSLEKYTTPASRHVCPSCKTKHKFSRYVDNATGEQLAEHVGKCERLDSCNFHFTPAQYFAENPNDKPQDFETWTPPAPAPPKPILTIDEKIVLSTLAGYGKNQFVIFLVKTFGQKVAQDLIDKYLIGSTKDGEAIFYQKDFEGEFRTGNILAYELKSNPKNFHGEDVKRVKRDFYKWVHTELKISKEKYHLSQVLFGLHLLSENLTATIAVVESEKSAIIGSVYLPQFIWVATSGMGGLNNKIKSLKDENSLCRRYRSASRCHSSNVGGLLPTSRTYWRGRFNRYRL